MEVEDEENILNEIVVLRENICHKSPKSTECSKFKLLSKQATKLLASIQAAKNMQEELDNLPAKNDASYINLAYQLKQHELKLKSEFDQFINRELKRSAVDIVESTPPEPQAEPKITPPEPQAEPKITPPEPQAEPKGSRIERAKSYINKANEIIESVAKAKYLMGAIKIALQIGSFVAGAHG